MTTHRRRWLALVIALALTSACGSQLSAEEVLKASGTKPAGAQTSAGPGAATSGATTATTPTGVAVAPGAAGPAAGNGATAPVSGDGGAPGAAAPAGTTACTTNDAGPIIIASVGNYSGAGGSSQANFPRAVQIWAAMINSRGGLCGRQVQVLVQDDGGDPARYGSLVRDMVENRHVVAFVGNGAVLSYQGGIDYHNQSGVPVFGNDCSVDAWFHSPVLAPTCPTTTDLLTGMVRAGVEISGKTNFGFVYCQEAQACHDGDQTLTSAAIQGGGATLVYRKSVSIAQVDFTAECQAARDAGAEIFTIGADAATSSRMASSCARQNWFPQYVAVALSFGPESISQRGLENVIVATDTFPFADASGGAIDEYNQAIQTFAPDVKASPALSMGWTGAKLFELVATRAAQTSGTITPQTLVAALQTVQNETLGGLTVPLTFGPDGAHPARCYFVLQGDGTGAGFKLPFGSGPRCL